MLQLYILDIVRLQLPGALVSALHVWLPFGFSIIVWSLPVEASRSYERLISLAFLSFQASFKVNFPVILPKSWCQTSKKKHEVN